MVILIVGMIGYVIGANLTGPGSVLSIVILVGTLLASVGEAAYLEWTRWAPHRRPDFEIEAFHWPGYAGVYVTNNDIDGNLRANIRDVRGPQGSLSWGPDQPWPLALGWGDALSSDPWVPRGERQSIKVVTFEVVNKGRGPRRYYEFRGPMGVRQIPLVAADGTEQRDIEIVIEYFRLRPEPSSMVRSERIRNPLGR